MSIVNPTLSRVTSAPHNQPDWYWPHRPVARLFKSITAFASGPSRVRKQGLYGLLERHPTQLKHHMDPCLPIMSLHWTDRSLSLQKASWIHCFPALIMPWNSLIRHITNVSSTKSLFKWFKLIPIQNGNHELLTTTNNITFIQHKWAIK